MEGEYPIPAARKAKMPSVEAWIAPAKNGSFLALVTDGRGREIRSDPLAPRSSGPLAPRSGERVRERGPRAL